MSRIVINDASCLIDLRKGRLLHVMLSLPFQFVIPFPVRASELLDFTAQEWQMLDDSGVETYDLEPAYEGHTPGKLDARSLLKLVGLGHVKGTGQGGLCLTASGHDLYQASLGR